MLSLLIAICAALFTAPVYAYIDPGTAGIILQAIIGGAVAAFAVLANFWGKIKAFFARLFGGKTDNRSDDQGGQ